MEKSLVVAENHQTSESDLVSKSVGSSIKIDSISIDLVSNDETDTKECEHFSIRGYVSEIRKKNWKMCWPFSSDGNHDKSEEQTCPLPPLHVSKFRWWRCQNCRQELGAEGSTPNNNGNACSYPRLLKSSATCSHVSSPGDATMLQPDLQQPKVLNIIEGGKVDATTVIDLNDDECLPSSSTGKKDNNFESAKKPITGLEIGSDDDLNQEVIVSGAATGVISGPMMSRRTDDIVPLSNESVEFCIPVCASNGNAEVELAKKMVNSVIEDSAGVFQAGKQPSAENHHSEVMVACQTSKVASMAGEVLDSVRSHRSELPSADENSNASSETADMLTISDLQDHQPDNSNGSYRRKTRKVRLLTELLAQNGDASSKVTRSESLPSNSVPEASAGVDVISAPQGMVTIKGNADLDQTKKRKLPHDEEQAPLEISSPNNLIKKDGIWKEGAENTGAFACSDSEEDGRLSLQLGKCSHWNKVTIPTMSKKKNKSTLVVGDDDHCMSLASSQEDVLKDIQRKAGDANNACAADTVLLKPGQMTFTSRGMCPFPLPPQKMERNSIVCKKKCKIDQFDGGQVSLNPWSSCVLRESPVTRNDVEMLQMPSLPAPFLSAQNASNEKELHHSLGSCLPTHGYDRNYISPLDDRQLIWRGNTSKEKRVLGRDIRSNYVGDSSFPTKSEPNAHLQKGVRCDLAGNTYTMSVLNEKLKSTRHVGNSSLMQQMDFSGTSNNGKSTERLEHSALAKKHSDQQADKVSEQVVPDDIPMEIVELMAKNQYERCLPDVENDKQPLEATVNASSAQMYAKGKLSISPEKTVHKPKPRVKNSRNDKMTRIENVGTTEQKSGDFVSPLNRNHLNFSQLGPAYGPTELRLITQCQEKVQSGVKFSATSSSSQNCHWIGDIMGHRSSQTNLRILESCNTCLSVPQQGKEAVPTWSTMIQNHMPFACNNPQKHAGPSTNTDMFSHCPSNLCKGNLNGNRDLNFLNLNVGNPEKHHRNIDSQILSTNMENPFACKHSGMGSLDLYSNETISAMHLLSLMDAGLSSGQPIDIDGASKFQKRPSFPHDRHAKDLPFLSCGGYKTNSTMKPPSYDYFGKNHLSENSRNCFPAVPNVDAPGFPFQCNKGAKKPTDLIGQASLKFQEREKAKGSTSTSQSNAHRSNKSVLTIGGSGTNHGSVPVHSMLLGTSDSMVLPLRAHVMENAAKHKLEPLHRASTNWHQKSSSKTEICSINRNPADFSVPEAGNVYMIRGEDLKFRDPPSSENRSGVDKSDGQKRKRQKKVTAVKGKV